MVSKSIINTIIKNASSDDKDNVIKILINYIQDDTNYNDAKVSHILEMLIDKTAIKTIDDVNKAFVEDNIELCVWQYDQYNIKDINIIGIDNINCTVKISFKHMEKINEDRGDIDWDDCTSCISYINYPKVLK